MWTSRVVWDNKHENKWCSTCELHASSRKRQMAMNSSGPRCPVLNVNMIVRISSLSSILHHITFHQFIMEIDKVTQKNRVFFYYCSMWLKVDFLLQRCAHLSSNYFSDDTRKNVTVRQPELAFLLRFSRWRHVRHPECPTRTVRGIAAIIFVEPLQRFSSSYFH